MQAPKTQFGHAGRANGWVQPPGGFAVCRSGQNHPQPQCRTGKSFDLAQDMLRRLSDSCPSTSPPQALQCECDPGLESRLAGSAARIVRQHYCQESSTGVSSSTLLTIASNWSGILRAKDKARISIDKMDRTIPMLIVITTDL